MKDSDFEKFHSSVKEMDEIHNGASKRFLSMNIEALEDDEVLAEYITEAINSKNVAVIKMAIIKSAKAKRINLRCDESDLCLTKAISLLSQLGLRISVETKG